MSTHTFIHAMCLRIFRTIIGKVAASLHWSHSFVVPSAEVRPWFLVLVLTVKIFE